MAMWKIIKIFVDDSTKQKLIFSKTGTDEGLKKMFHPSQLQQKFGGEAEDINLFWPPYSPSDEYGVDPIKLKNKSPYDATFYDDDGSLALPHEEHENNLGMGVSRKSVGEMPIRPENIQLEERSKPPPRSDLETKKRIDQAKKVKTGKGCRCVIF